MKAREFIPCGNLLGSKGAAKGTFFILEMIEQENANRPAILKYSDQPVWYQQSCHIQSYLNHLSYNF